MQISPDCLGLTTRLPPCIPPEELPKTATVGVVDVYNSRYEFPKDVPIKALRVWQVLPKVEPFVGIPRLGVTDEQPGRQCLGTVPVEDDGSAYFKIPVNVPVYFQALDADGCAVQTMRRPPSTLQPIGENGSIVLDKEPVSLPEGFDPCRLWIVEQTWR